MAVGKCQNSCPSCKNSVKETDYAIGCDGFCKFWWHSKCVNISDVEYANIQELEEKVKWFCQDCDFKVNRLLTKITDM
jgi:hypothetical protein